MDKLPPYDLESETYLLEACCCPGGIEKAVKIVGPQDFYSDGGKLIFAKMLKFYQSRRGFTLSIMDDSFRDNPVYEAISRILDTLVPVTAETATHFAKIIKSLSNRRQAIRAAYSAYEKLHDFSNSVREISDSLKVEAGGLEISGGVR